MGAVHLARDLRLDRDGALKMLAGISATRLQGLRQEARAMATMTHAGVAPIHAIESWQGRPFLVVEFLAGGTLGDRPQTACPRRPQALISSSYQPGVGEI